MLLHLDTGLSIGTGRALICIGEAIKPLSTPELADAIAAKYDKRYTDQKMSDILLDLRRRNWITMELTLTKRGLRALKYITEHQNEHMGKFWRKSNSPNVDDRIEKPKTKESAVHKAIPGLNAGTW